MRLQKILNDFDELRDAFAQGATLGRVQACLILLSCVGVSHLFQASAMAQDKSDNDQIYESILRPAFQSYCLKCHG
eukprot:COSAG06_NODE_32627_length_503_cov_0.626238_1_plen_75_part_10